jgi:two-component system KDP operon response regulator KdpE
LCLGAAGGLEERAVRVLVISDDPQATEVGRLAVTTAGGEVQRCDGVCAAGRSILREGADLILLDLGLPGLTGEAALRLLQEVAPRVPVLILATKVSAVTTEGLLMAGARRLVTKPVDPQQLLQIIRDEVAAVPVRAA